MKDFSLRNSAEETDVGKMTVGKRTFQIENLDQILEILESISPPNGLNPILDKILGSFCYDFIREDSIEVQDKLSFGITLRNYDIKANE